MRRMRGLRFLVATMAGATALASAALASAAGPSTAGPAAWRTTASQRSSRPKTRHLVVLDGGGLVTLSGGGKRRGRDPRAGPVPEPADYDTLIAGTVMHDNTAREDGGAICYVVDSGWGKLTLNESHLHHDPSGVFQTYPGIYDNIDGHDGPPVMIHSTDN